MSKAWIHRLSNVSIENKTATCANCGNVSIKIRTMPSGKLKPRCRIAVNLEKRNYGGQRKSVGLPPDKPCEICNERKPLVYDHSHTTGNFRGWLCKSCNLALGLIKDDIKSLENAIKYLQQHRSLG